MLGIGFDGILPGWVVVHNTLLPQTLKTSSVQVVVVYLVRPQSSAGQFTDKFHCSFPINLTLSYTLASQGVCIVSREENFSVA